MAKFFIGTATAGRGRRYQPNNGLLQLRTFLCDLLQILGVGSRPRSFYWSKRPRPSQRSRYVCNLQCNGYIFESDFRRINFFQVHSVNCGFFEFKKLPVNLFSHLYDLILIKLKHFSYTALSTRIIERIFSGCVTKGAKSNRANAPLNAAKMSYTEFVWFLLSEEDKTHPTAVEYWFRYDTITITKNVIRS